MPTRFQKSDKTGQFKPMISSVFIQPKMNNTNSFSIHEFDVQLELIELLDHEPLALVHIHLHLRNPHHFNS